jgi:predicted ArsR family transcriptional regulator
VSVPAAGSLRDLASLSLLADPVRGRLYTVVVELGRTVSRDDAAAACGISRSLAAYHLDRLAVHGLLDVSYARSSGRSGPGAGRPAKRYRRASRELVARTPPRDYRLLAELLVRAVDADGSGTVRATLEHAAGRLGAEIAAAGENLEQVLHERGYEPHEPEPGLLQLRNCPFAALASRSPELVCQLNLAFIRGILAAEQANPEQAQLTPAPEACCVTVRRERGLNPRRRG